MGCLLWLKSYSQIRARPAAVAGGGRPMPDRAVPQTMRMLNSGRPSTCATITSPRTTGPTFSGVPE